MNVFKRLSLRFIKSKATRFYVIIIILSFSIDFVINLLCTNEFFSFLILKSKSPSFFESLFGITATIVTLQAVLLPLVLERSDKVICGCTFVEVLLIDAWPLNPFHLIYVSIALLPFQYYFAANRKLGALVFLFVFCCIVLFILFYLTVTLSKNAGRSLNVIKVAAVRAICKKKTKLWEHIYFCIQNKIADGLLENQNESIENAIEIAGLFEYIFLNSIPSSEFIKDMNSLVNDITTYSNIEVTVTMMRAFIKSLRADEEILIDAYSGNVEKFMANKENCLLKNTDIVEPIMDKLIQNKDCIDKCILNSLRLELSLLPYFSKKYDNKIKELGASH